MLHTLRKLATCRYSHFISGTILKPAAHPWLVSLGTHFNHHWRPDTIISIPIYLPFLALRILAMPQHLVHSHKRRSPEPMFGFYYAAAKDGLGCWATLMSNWNQHSLSTQNPGATFFFKSLHVLHCTVSLLLSLTSCICIRNSAIQLKHFTDQFPKR